jgi:hypothetical protein
MTKPSSGKQKRVLEAMQADKVWDKIHKIKQGSPQDKILDAAVKKRAMKGK